MIIFDNSDWYPNTIKYLRDNLNWIEVDFHGFGPINDYTWTTSIFINRDIILDHVYNLHSASGAPLLSEDDIL